MSDSLSDSLSVSLISVFSVTVMGITVLLPRTHRVGSSSERQDLSSERRREGALRRAMEIVYGSLEILHGQSCCR